MTIPSVESLPLGRFIYASSWTPIKGTYIYPLKLFAVAERQPNDPNDYLEVVRVIDVNGTNVAITRGGGLFVRENGTVTTTSAVADLLNTLLCEFALRGIVSQPITDTDVQRGKLIGRYASITGGAGSYAERTWGPYTLLISPVRDMGASHGQRGNYYWPPNFYWTNYDPRILDEIADLSNALRLQNASPTMPTLLVAAAYHSTRHNVAETILSCWIIAEQILSSLWAQHLESISSLPRQRRLKDSRTYTASVRAEVLLTAGVLQVEAYEILQQARKVRNDLAHGSNMSHEAASICLQAMSAMMTLFGVSPNRLPTYSMGGGGIGPPQVALPPDFPF